ncbi:MAG: TatD family hydrolase [Anaerolineales bacterium]|nr:TatD family hydrolase [Anaerolineales bacterium]
MALTDTHCHLNLTHFDSDRFDVLERACQTGVRRILIPGIDLASSDSALHLAASHPALFAAIGIHPTESAHFGPEMLESLRERLFSASAQANKLVAIGEIGLDYYWDAAPREQQRAALEAQLNLAAEAHLPVVIHLREAGDAPQGECVQDLLAILRQWVGHLRAQGNPLAERPGVLHSFSGTPHAAEQALTLNFYIGISGPVTYKNAAMKRELARALPLDRILIETDAPYLAPMPQRGRRNEPAFVRYIADKIAEIHSKHAEEIAAQTTANAGRLFAW